MEDEIKEIKVNKANKSITFINNGIAFLQFGVADEILDLITNLQEELKGYKQERENLFKTTHDLQKEIKRLENKLSQSIKWSERRTIEWLDYKSRCEKLREYINTHKVSDTISFPLMKKDQENQVKSCFDYEFNQIYKKDLENILNGGENND